MTEWQNLTQQKSQVLSFFLFGTPFVNVGVYPESPEPGSTGINKKIKTKK